VSVILILAQLLHMFKFISSKYLKITQGTEMSIEDIDYLKENSEKDSCVLYIDSAQRDRDKFAKPNNYVFPLDEPFRFVYGLDVLDASIPSTMFNIDVNNNHVRAGLYEIIENPNYESGNDMFVGYDGQLIESDIDRPTTTEFQVLFNELGGVDGFDDILSDINYIPNAKPFTYKLLFTTRMLLTAAYYRGSFLPPANPPQDNSFLTDAHIEDMFYHPSANGSKFLFLVRESLSLDKSTIILNANELNREMFEWSLETLYRFRTDFFIPEIFADNPQVFLQDSAQIKLRSRINSCRVLTFVRRRLDQQPNVQIIEDLSEVPELPATSPFRYTMFFEFTKNGQSFYIQYKTNWDLSFILTQNALSLISTLIRFSMYPDVKIVEKLRFQPAESYSVQPPDGDRFLTYMIETYRLYCVTYDSFLENGSKNGYERVLSTAAYYMQIQMQLITLTPGNYGITNFLTEIKRAFQGSNIDVENGFVDDISIRPNLRFSSLSPFFLDMERSTLRTVMGFDEYAQENNDGYYTKVFYKNNKRLFGSIAVPVPQEVAALYNNASVVYKIISPGVVYLLGTRYCILRCEELDDHLYGSRAYGRFSPGIALFKMFNVNDVAHQRIDFVNLKKKPFHPIGKLDKLTLRFETSDGSLYDFKSANHLLVVSIKYYVPSQKRQFTQSVLNPNYQRDFASYFLGRSITYKENSEDDDDDDEDDGAAGTSTGDTTTGMGGSSARNTNTEASFVQRIVKKEIKYFAEEDSDQEESEEDEEPSSASEFDFA
jgi:hypothetical protein